MSVAQRMNILQAVFQMTAIAIVSVINHYPIKELHLFWDTLNRNEKKTVEGLIVDTWIYS